MAREHRSESSSETGVTHAALFWESEPPLTFAHMPLQKQQSETKSEYLGQFKLLVPCH
jgi:hypothetical protein